jgi:hypothetical protein
MAGTLFFFLNGQKVLDEHVEPDQSVLQYLRLSTYRLCMSFRDDFFLFLAVCRLVTARNITPNTHTSSCV